MVTIHYRNAHIYLAEGVYDPAEDSYLFADAAIEQAKDGYAVLEIGTGTGFVAAVLLANRNVQLMATDINPLAVLCARSNGIEVIRTDMFAAIKKKKYFDLILFNPPYLPTSIDEKVPGWLNYAFDGGPDGRDAIRKFLLEVGDHLREDGSFLLLISSLTGIGNVFEMISSYGFIPSIVASTKCPFEELVVVKGQTKEEGQK